jgi:DNA-binding response OmpR family regulator
VPDSESLLKRIAPDLPYVRRYARSLTEHGPTGDEAVRSTLEALATGAIVLDPDLAPRAALYRAFEEHVSYLQLPVRQSRDHYGGNLGDVGPLALRAFLLTALEGFTPPQAAQILQIEEDQLEALLRSAQTQIERQLVSNVLIIEDDPPIAMLLAEAVTDLGHTVLGVARTRGEATAAAVKRLPGLILADIALADGSSGIDAVNDILARHPTPVIFVTAFPERLLTGERPEPAFLITKPFQIETLKAAIGQALFFGARHLAAAPQASPLPDHRQEDIPPLNERPRTPESGARPEAFARSSRAVQVEVVDGRAVSIPVSPVVPFPVTELEALRIDLCREVQRVAERSELHNHQALVERLRRIERSLGQPLVNLSAVVLAAQAASFARAAARAETDELVGDVQRDVSTVADDIDAFVREFTVIHKELSAEPALDDISPNEATELVTVAVALERAPDTAVSPDLKEAFAEVRTSFEADRDSRAGNALASIIVETLKAFGRWIRSRAALVWDEVEKSGIKYIANTLLIGGVVAALRELALAFPNTFGFVAELERVLSQIRVHIG